MKEKHRDNDRYFDKAVSGAMSETLVVKAIGGDGVALYKLCEALGRRVMFLVMRKLHKQMDAEDAARKVFIRICTEIGGLRNPKAFNAWLYSIVLEEIGRHCDESGIPDELLDMGIYTCMSEKAGEKHHSYEHAVRDEEAKAIMKVIDALPGRQQEAVMLYYYQGFSVAEAAEIMGTTQSVVARNLKLAQRRLKGDSIIRIDIKFFNGYY